MRVAVDSGVFIYALEGDDAWGDAAISLLRSIDSGKFEGVASTLCLAEVVVRPWRLSEEKGLSAQLFVEGLNHLDFYEINEEAAVLAGRLRACNGNGLKLIDSLHLASAIIAGADVFVTNDHTLAKLKLDDLKIILLGEPVE